MTASEPAAYAVSEFRDPEAEVARLAYQARVLAEVEEARFRELGFPDEGDVLDVGCGPGFVATRLMAGRPALRIVGVDRDPELVERARRSMEAVVGDAGALPFPDGRFRCVFSRLVLRHLARPEQALAEARRVLEPGGRLLVLDSDDGALLLDPTPEGFSRALAARQETFRRRGADPFVARRLAWLLRQAEFGALALRTLSVDSVTLGTEAFSALVLAPIADGIDPDLLAPDDVRAAAASLGDWAARDDAFGMTTVVLVAGTKRSSPVAHAGTTAPSSPRTPHSDPPLR